MPIYTRRWEDSPDSGELADKRPTTRILVTRYRPRGLPKSAETWDLWMPHLGPSRELHAAAYGKVGQPISWAVYRSRYLTEMRTQRAAIAELAGRVAKGESLSLLCSSQCTRESRCHRGLLRELIEAQVQSASVAE